MKAFFLNIFHKLAAHPWVYDRIQTAAGQKISLERIRKILGDLDADVIVDVGGGTGATRSIWPKGCRYICLDIEMPKLIGFRSKNANGLAVLGDATRMPFGDGVADILVCMAVVHHLTDTMLEQALDEAFRVLRVGGRVVLLDPVLDRNRWLGRALWRLDRGSNPRTAEDLREKLESRFELAHWENYAVYHEYVLGIGVRR
jgi:ubiquinone/menaquinone biosynthesis C-methylase UbiE